jgi:hypothetical protein
MYVPIVEELPRVVVLLPLSITLVPMAITLFTESADERVSYPMKIELLVLLFDCDVERKCPALHPIPTLFAPVTNVPSASLPTAVLLLAVVTAPIAAEPTPVFTLPVVIE